MRCSAHTYCCLVPSKSLSWIAYSCCKIGKVLQHMKLLTLRTVCTVVQGHLWAGNRLLL